MLIIILVSSYITNIEESFNNCFVFLQKNNFYPQIICGHHLVWSCASQDQTGCIEDGHTDIDCKKTNLTPPLDKLWLTCANKKSS